MLVIFKCRAGCNTAIDVNRIVAVEQLERHSNNPQTLISLNIPISPLQSFVVWESFEVVLNRIQKAKDALAKNKKKTPSREEILAAVATVNLTGTTAQPDAFGGFECSEE